MFLVLSNILISFSFFKHYFTLHCLCTLDMSLLHACGTIYVPTMNFKVDSLKATQARRHGLEISEGHSKGIPSIKKKY